MKKLGVLLNMPKNNDNVNHNLVIANDNLVNACNNKQSKSESKKDKRDKRDKSIYGFPKMHFLTHVLIQRKYIKQSDLNILKYNELFEEAIMKFGYDNVLSGVNYLIGYSKRAVVEIEDRYSFMKKSLLNNLERFKKLESLRGHEFEDWIKRDFL